ncbi:histidine phosphotransferase family protein [Paeniroseomonas aquatica]|uniref:histidine phosphotransferase family protein n=1 Tax=Paeniroseomonas aquatica TaxID=373043 RepID=UPI003610EA06
MRFDLDGLAPGTLLPAAIVPVALNAALLGAEALPRGGTVVLSGTAEAGLVVLPQPHRAPAPGAGTVSWPPLLLRLLAGAAAEEGLAAGPRQVVAPLLLAMLAELGWRASSAPVPGRSPCCWAPPEAAGRGLPNLRACGGMLRRIPPRGPQWTICSPIS